VTKLLAAGAVLMVMLAVAKQYPGAVIAIGLGGLMLFGVACSANDRNPRTIAARSVLKSARGGGFVRCCGVYVDDTSGHEAGHLVTAEDLGYSVSGAVVNKDGTGFTEVPGWGRSAWDTMVMAWGGQVGEQRTRAFKSVGLNGGRTNEGTDAWWVHKLAPKVAKQRGISIEQAISQTHAAAQRSVARRSGRWASVKSVLEQNGKI